MSTRFGRVLVKPGKMSRPSEATNPSASFHPSLKDRKDNFRIGKELMGEWVEISVLVPEGGRADAVEG